MTWTTTATLPQRRHGPGWTTDATPPQRQTGAGWFPLLEKIVAFHTEGALAATVATSYPYSSAALSATGALSATVAPIKTAVAAFTGAGSLTGTINEIRFRTVTFTAGSDGLAVTVNDGLSAIISGGSFGDGLSAIISGGAFGDGLSATISGTITFARAADLSGGGALSATVLYGIAARFGDA